MPGTRSGGAGGESPTNFCCTYFEPRLPPPRSASLVQKPRHRGDSGRLRWLASPKIAPPLTAPERGVLSEPSASSHPPAGGGKPGTQIRAAALRRLREGCFAGSPPFSLAVRIAISVACQDCSARSVLAQKRL